jgi:alkylated DNA repair dioxygenase AlkB
VRIPLTDDTWLELDEGFWPEAERLLATLRQELQWEQREIVLFGKRILQPRLIAWAGERPYRYSGQTLEPRPFTPSVRRVLDALAPVAPFNHVLVNRYRDGNDSMGLHADAEPELGPDPVVATLSLGATRRFVVKPRAPGPSRTFDLRSGSLLVMAGACQSRFRHGIPRQPAVREERISLTFRRVTFSPGGAS